MNEIEKANDLDLDKTEFNDAENPNPKTKLKQQIAQNEIADNLNLESTESLVPESLRKRYLQAENKFYFRDEENTLAFEDKGRRLATEHNDPEVARAMVELAKARGWHSIKVKGSEEFKREIWLQASLQNIKILGFQPKEVDISKLDDFRQEKERRIDKTANTVEKVYERNKTQAVNEKENTLNYRQQQVIDAIKAVMRQRGDSEKAVEMAATMVAENFKSDRVYAGKVVEHNRAPFNHDEKNPASYYITLETPKGNRTVWGADIEREIKERRIVPGDQITLAYQGKETVQVVVKERDKQGNVISERQSLVNRNTWQASKIDQVREAVMQKIANSERQPILKVYDKDAPRTDNRQEQTRRVAQENERVRG